MFIRPLVLLLAMLGIGAHVGAQNITLSAKIQDKITGEPLPFASIGIKGKAEATVSNLQGEFDFHIPYTYRNEILVISMLGYENFESPVWSLLETKTKIIGMDKSTTVLQELVVADSLSGSEILRIALARVEQNFPMKPFLLDGFYRDVKKVGGTYIALLEAAVQVYDDNYAEPRNKNKLRERVRLVEVRKSLGYENKFTTYFGQKNLLEDLLLHNNIRYHDLDDVTDYLNGIAREKNSYYNNQEVYVVSYDKDFTLKLYIDTKDYAIIRLEYENTETGDNLDSRKHMVSKHIGHHHTIEFRKFEGKMFLSYINITTREDWYEKDTEKFKFQTELNQYFMVNSIEADTKVKISSTQRMRNYGLEYQDYPYNKEFWSNYNVIKETPVDQKIIHDLEKIAPLESQFEEN